eukprot:TRINITY_DN8945_c0_g1_i1.p1 TRINITY_DN8945_c0_g1~~TRINITY_DN8945_c0_g1_i1.p1  ORF type:complete len:291 (-),score=45.23 TRINITY_DN8945_c0_g1_i1:152-1024(-)
MGKYATLVIGPAGSGKSTYCETFQKHCETLKRTVHVVNLDPAAETFKYTPSIDIRDLISLSDVMSMLNYGPNGGLVYCMEYLADNLAWLEEQIQDYDDDYLLIDCPGQIELYSHLPAMRMLVSNLQKLGYRVCAVYLLDSVSITDASRFISGILMCLSAMVRLELPHINVLSKCDLLEDKKQISDFLDPDIDTLVQKLTNETSGRYTKLNSALGSLIEDYNMVSFLPLDISDEESIDLVLQHVDHSIQFGEDLEPQEPKDEDEHSNDADKDEESALSSALSKCNASNNSP